jgi:hypothetical protein
MAPLKSHKVRKKYVKSNRLQKTPKNPQKKFLKKTRIPKKLNPTKTKWNHFTLIKTGCYFVLLSAFLCTFIFRT